MVNKVFDTRANFYADNGELASYLERLDLVDVVRLKENNFQEHELYPDAPANHAAALDHYTGLLLELGKVCATGIAERAQAVDQTGVSLRNGKVSLAPGTLTNLEEMRACGVMGVLLPRAYGGKNLPVTVYCMMTEMVARADASLQNLFALQNIAETIAQFGTDEQKNSYLPQFASGAIDGAMALTEPGAGSDLQAVSTTATLNEATGEWRLNGVKHFITNGCADVLLVLARSEPGSTDGRGLSVFIVKASPEVVVKRLEDKLGIHGSPTCEIHLQNAPGELLGKRRYGLTRYVMSLMNGARLAISAQAVGLAEAARQAAWNYCQKRQQFGRGLAEIPAVAEMLGRQDALTSAARALLYETSRYVDLRDAWSEWSASHPEDTEAREASRHYSHLADFCTPLAKAFTTEAANQVAYDSLQCLGGKGYMREQSVERLYRDARITNIYEGTTQMQVVAATGGLVKRTLEPILAELAALPYQGELAEWAARIETARQETDSCLALIEDTGGQRLEQFAPRLVRMLTLVYVSYLLLRTAQQNPACLDVTRRFLWEFLPEVSMHGRMIREPLP